MMGRDEFTGTIFLARFIVRRDRVRLLLWVGGFTVIMVLSASSLRGVYTDAQSIRAYAELVGGNPAMRVFVGPGYGFDTPSIGVILVAETQLWGMIAAALMSIVLVVRQTRAAEDDGTVDLLLASVMGRHAPLAAAGIVVGGAHVVLGALTLVGFVAVGYGAIGSLAVVASVVSMGWFFAALAGVCAQVASGARSALAVSILAVVVAFLVRAAGDATGSWVRWVSPIGWAQGIRAFTGDEAWWTLAVSAAAVAVAAVLAAILAERRDIGSGYVADRGGASAGGRWTRHPVGLAAHLQRNMLAAWVVAVVVMALVYGLIADEVDDLVAQNPVLAEILTRLEGATPTDAYLATAVSMLAVISTGWVMTAMLAIRSHESAGRAGLLLSGPLGRVRWFAAHSVVALAGAMVVLIAAGIGLGVGRAVATGETGDVVRIALASASLWPALAVVASLAACLIGWLPRYSMLAWGIVVFVVVVGFLGDVLGLSDAIVWWSPFEHLGRPPVTAPPVPSVLGVGAVAVAFGALAFAGFRRRDLTD